VIDFSGIGKVAGDLNRKQQAERVDKLKIIGNALDHYRSICYGDPAVAFCVNVAHAEHVAAEFRAGGFKFYSVDGSMDDKTRERIFAQLGDGSIHGVTSCDLISEGTDIPAIAAAILLRRTESTGLYLQQVGRALRPVPGKERAVILDHVQNYMLHGFPDDEREWSLDGIEKKKRGSKESSGPAPRQCHECFAVYSATLNVCPQCGTARLQKEVEIEVAEGQLVEISEAEKERLRMKTNARKEQGKAQSLADLEALAAARGYKKGWAAHVWRSRNKSANG
jgi:superfamily II DNA or RNA helicase